MRVNTGSNFYRLVSGNAGLCCAGYAGRPPLPAHNIIFFLFIFKIMLFNAHLILSAYNNRHLFYYRCLVYTQEKQQKQRGHLNN